MYTHGPTRQALGTYTMHKINLTANIVGNCLPVLAAALCMPLLIEELGFSLFSWVAIGWGLLTSFALLDFGVARVALVRLSSQQKDSGTWARECIASFVAICFAAGLISIFCLSLLLVLGSYIKPDELSSEAFFEFSISLIGTLPIIFLFGFLKSVLESVQRFLLINVIKTVLQIALYALPLMIVKGVDDPGDLIISEIFIGLLWLRLALVAILVFFARSLLRQIFEYVYRPGLQEISPYFASGKWVAASSFASLPLSQLDKWVMLSSVGASSGGMYGTASTIVTKFLLWAEAVVGVYLPKVALDSRSYVLPQTIAIGIPAFLVLVILWAWGPMLLAWWLGAMYHESVYAYCSVLIFAVMANAFAQIPYSLLHVKKRFKVVANIHLCELFLFVGGCVVLLIYDRGIYVPYLVLGRSIFDLVLLSIVYLLIEDGMKEQAIRLI